MLGCLGISSVILTSSSLLSSASHKVSMHWQNVGKFFSWL
jgi:hypothetical protein